MIKARESLYFDEEDQSIESVWAAIGRQRLPLLIKGSSPSAHTGAEGIRTDHFDNPSVSCADSSLYTREPGVLPFNSSRKNTEIPYLQKTGTAKRQSLRLSKNHVIASQCSHWRGNPPDIQIFSILNQQLLRSAGGFPHQSADWFGMTPYLSDFF